LCLWLFFLPLLDYEKGEGKVIMKTYLPKNPGNKRDWILIDANGKRLGRLAAGIANILRGKNKVIFSPQVDVGDFVVVINAEKVVLTGKKEQQKIYKRYSGYRGGLKEMTAAEVRAKDPTRMIKEAVRRMLPGNNLCRKMMRRLKVYAGGSHPHKAQNVKEISFN